MYDDVSIVRDFRERYQLKVPSMPHIAVVEFKKIIYGYYKKFKRDFPWRHTTDPYHILVSEIMLQQTQVARVAEKYPEFIRVFPTTVALAAASLKEVLAVWQGMGYNRRARNLHEIAGRVQGLHGGTIPGYRAELALLPGIGPATAASISAFAFNAPEIFIETNIRAVFIYFFFHDRDSVRDDEIIPLVRETLDKKNPRRWYSALMDYGAMLKKRHPNPSRRSAHHQIQAPFQGSRRQTRGLVLKALLDGPGMTVQRLARAINRPLDATASALDKLVKEGLVNKRGRIFHL